MDRMLQTWLQLLVALALTSCFGLGHMEDIWERLEALEAENKATRVELVSQSAEMMVEFDILKTKVQQLEMAQWMGKGRIAEMDGNADQS